MESELEKALELIKNSCTREEIIKRFYTDKSGDINLMNLNLKGCDVYLSGIEANLISNVSQKAKEIFNQDQIADDIYNGRQQAKIIDNKGQKLIK